MPHRTRPHLSKGPDSAISAPRLETRVMDCAIWSCSRRHVLGVIDGERLHIRFARGHQYRASFPASCICRQCGELNEIESASAWAVHLSERL